MEFQSSQAIGKISRAAILCKSAERVTVPAVYLFEVVVNQRALNVLFLSM